MNKYNNFALLGRDMKSKMQQDLDRLNSITQYSVKYGIPRGKETEDGQSIAMIGRRNNYGTVKIPARPWLSTVNFRYKNKIYNDIKKALNTIKSRDNLREGEVRRVLEKYISLSLINYMRDNILNGDWKANRPTTIKIKKSSKPLIDEGNMLASVNSFAEKRIT